MFDGTSTKAFLKKPPRIDVSFFQKADAVDALAHELAEGVVPRTREDGVE